MAFFVPKIRGHILVQPKNRRIATEAYADTAKTEAIADASTKYATLFPAALGSTENLNTVQIPGRRRQNQSSIAGNTALNYPPGATHGYLDTVSMDGTAMKYLEQTWTETWSRWQAKRRLYNGVWSTWGRIGASEAEALIAPVEARVAALENETSPEVQIQPGNAVVYGAYRPDAWAHPDGTTIYWNNPDGTNVVPEGYLGDGYVGTLGAVTGYTDMLVTKAELNNTVDVSCINPTTGRHVTYRLQGTDNATWLDDMQIIEEIWVGSAPSGVPSKDTEISPRSNMEWAFQIDFSGAVKWVPYHGDETAIDTGATRGLFRMDGTAIDLSSLAIGDTITGLDGVKLRQSVYGRHPDSGTTNWVRIDQITTISPDGMIQSESTWEALRDVRVGSNYGPMTPVHMGLMDTLHVQGGGSYPLDMTAPATTRYDTITEGREAVSMLMTSATGDKFVAVSILDPHNTYLLGNPRSATVTPMRIEQRNTGWIKIYPSGFESGAYITKGTVWKMGAQWRFGEATDPAQYV